MSLIILDRDGVINEESDDSIRGVEDWRPIPGSLTAIADLSRAGHTVVVATNQSGLGRGLFDLDDLEAIHARLYHQVEERGGSLAGIFYCPHSPEEGCNCRKPATGLLQAIEEETGLNARGALFIGDSLRDLQAAQMHGCEPILVRTGRGEDTLLAIRSGGTSLHAAHSITVYDDLADAVEAFFAQQHV